MTKSNRTTLLRGARVLQGKGLVDEGGRHDVLIRGDRIESIVPAGSSVMADEVVDLEGHILCPGLINGHQHSHEHFQRGRSENLPLELWMNLVRTRTPVTLTPQQIYLRTMIGAIESIRSGCTTLVDDLAVGPALDEERLDAVLQAYEDSGVRALVGFSMMDKPVVDSFPFVEDAFDAELLSELRSARRPASDDYLDLITRRVKAGHHPKESRVALLLAPSAPQRCSQDFLLRIRQMADEYDLPVITHVQETRLQVVTGELLYGMPMVEYLASIGFLKPSTSLIHAVWLNPREIDLLAEHGATAQHNPWSNLLLGSGIQPVRELLKAGVNVSLGSDGSCSTVTSNMLNVLGTAAGISKLRGHDPGRWLSAREALVAATQGGAKALGFGDSLGVIEPGARADLFACRIDTIAFTPLSNPIRQLVYAERGAGVAFSMVDGRIVMHAGRLAQINEAKILSEIEREYQLLVSQFDQAEHEMRPVLNAVEKIYKRSLRCTIGPDTFPARVDTTDDSRYLGLE
ncbi:amidohydrolase family protein [Orrella marina]|uniref:Amidohydrolase n=1 Tax=Orrella marina TaxID=2163011 RepID=A0A2R4XNP1_9BURK|nr:amidohydrolase [Orrella marina]AWB35319.1 amidohydrolase [Orrella marina]